MGVLIDLQGQTFGWLTVKGKAKSDSRGAARWNCICRCGATHEVAGRLLRSSQVKSCGCLLRSTRQEKRGCETSNERVVERQKLARVSVMGDHGDEHLIYPTMLKQASKPWA